MEGPRGIPAQSEPTLDEIGDLALTDWWLSTFIPAERAYIEQTYRPYTLTLSGELEDADILLENDNAGVDDSDEPAAEEMVKEPVRSAGAFLNGLAGWFYKPADRHIALRILKKAEDLAGDNVLDLHFIYLTMIKANYRSRELALGARDAAVAACEKQIALGPRAAAAFIERYGGKCPMHTGFQQLAIIREKQQNFDEVIRLCDLAEKQGWTGDWQKRINRCKRKMKSR